MKITKNIVCLRWNSGRSGANNISRRLILYRKLFPRYKKEWLLRTVLEENKFIILTMYSNRSLVFDFYNNFNDNNDEDNTTIEAICLEIAYVRFTK